MPGTSVSTSTVIRNGKKIQTTKTTKRDSNGNIQTSEEIVEEDLKTGEIKRSTNQQQITSGQQQQQQQQTQSITFTGMEQSHQTQTQTQFQFQQQPRSSNSSFSSWTSTRFG